MNLKSLKPAVKKAVMPTIVSTLIFFLTYFVFGAENSMIAPFATLIFLRFRSMHRNYGCIIKNHVVFTAIAVLTFFAVQTPTLCVVINGLALFWIAYILIDEYDPVNYFPLGMALIFFQIAPADTAPDLLRRLGALAVTFLIIVLFVLIPAKLAPARYPVRDLISEGFSICRRQLDLCSLSDGSRPDPGEMDSLHRELRDASLACSREIYAYNRSSLLPRGKINWYCHFILVFQVINYYTRHPERELHGRKAEQLYDTFFREFHTTAPTGDFRRMHFRLRRPDLRSFRLRFALRQVITVTPCLIFAWVSQLPNIYWLVISVFFMMIPFTDHTMSRVRQRVGGTLAGIVICLVLFSFFPGFPARVALMILANFLIYGANGYGPTVAYITCSALALQTLDGSLIPVLAERLIYTLTGGGIALLANYLIFPIRLKNQCAYLMEMLISIRVEITDVLARTAAGSETRRFQIDQRIIKSYLIFKRLEHMQETMPEKDRISGYREFEREHIDFMAECLSKYLL